MDPPSREGEVDDHALLQYAPPPLSANFPKAQENPLLAHPTSSNRRTRQPSPASRDKAQLPADPCLITADESEEQLPIPASEVAFVPQSVDSLNVEEAIKAKVIGERIRRLRLKRSMGLVELGKHTGLSASFLSQLETGRVIPTLRNLSRVALAFGKDLGHFFQDNKKNQFKKSRAKDRIRLPLGDKSSPVLISESMGALIPDRSLVPCIADFLPMANNSSFEPSTFHGQELVYVLSGPLNITTENDRQKLETDDLAWIDGQLKRKYFCSPGKPARAMIISCPRKD